jgi:uncharacterized membrane protein YqgA involved in biofilm formation
MQVKFDNFLIPNTDGKKSLTATAFVLGVLTITIKLLLAEMTIFGTKFSQFTGVDYAAALTALGGVYVLRRGQKKEDSDAK